MKVTTTTYLTAESDTEAKQLAEIYNKLYTNPWYNKAVRMWKIVLP